MKGKACILLICLCAALGLHPQSTAYGYTTIGSDLSGSVTGSGCDGTSCTLVTTLQSGTTVTAPSNSVIVRWRVKTGGSVSGTVKIRVLRESGGSGPGTFIGIRGSSAESIGSSTTAEYNSRVPISSGEYIGLDASDGLFVTAPMAGNQGFRWLGGLSDGSSLSGSSDNNRTLFFNADIEADSDGDGYGDETQDSCPGDATLQSSCSNGSSPGGDAPTGDTSPPAISNLRISPKKLKAKQPSSSKSRAIKRAVFTYSVSESSTVRFAIEKRTRKGCASSQYLNLGTKCSYSELGTLTAKNASAGVNKTKFSGKLGTRRLKAGHYRAKAVATDTANNSSAAVYVKFTVL